MASRTTAATSRSAPAAAVTTVATFVVGRRDAVVEVGGDAKGADLEVVGTTLWGRNRVGVLQIGSAHDRQAEEQIGHRTSRRAIVTERAEDAGSVAEYVADERNSPMAMV